MATHSDASKRDAVDESVALVNDGQSTNEASTVVAAKYGVTKRTIQNWAVKLGTPLG